MATIALDTSCTDALKPGRLVTGKRLDAEAFYRRITTPRGTLRGGEDEANYGIDLPGLIGKIASPSHIAALPGQIKNELLKDERVIDVAVTVEATAQGPSTTYQIKIIVQTDDGAVELLLSVDNVTAELLGIS